MPAEDLSEVSTAADLTVERKAAAVSGRDFWTAGVHRSVFYSDGPNGVRRQVEASDHLGMNAALPATCFPPGVALAQTWDPDLIERVSSALAVESLALGVDVLLGPGINIKRDPRGGRNFEYLSEDPWLSGRLGVAWVHGLQSGGVGASVKHFAANNAEWDRMRSSSDVDERPLREIYLRAFERVVRDAQPWTVMCSYNGINGVPAAQNRWLLTEVLRDDWGFDGIVVSDWGAVRDLAASVQAGLDLEMPKNEKHIAEVVEAVRTGELDEAILDQAIARLEMLESRTAGAQLDDGGFDQDAHHDLAREVASRAIVLLKNDRSILPLRPESKIAVLGEFAATPRFQGGGSSHITPTRLDVPLRELERRFGADTVEYRAGFSIDGTGDDEQLLAEALETAGSADVAVVFIGLSSREESEGFDRDHIRLPANQIELARAVAAIQPNTVVVLSHGGVVQLTELVDDIPVIVDAALLGQAGGGAIAAVLAGDVNPSGRLAETVPRRIEDAASYLNFPGSNAHVRYGEGLYVGYRWYDARALEVTFPFGHGLSYTSFEYTDLTLRGGDGIEASVVVRNTGARRGREVVQAYARKSGSVVDRPLRELVGSAVVDLAPGEQRTVRIDIEARDLGYWEERLGRWLVEDGDYEVFVGASSRDLRLGGETRVDGESLVLPISLESTLGELAVQANAAAILGVMASGTLSPQEGAEIDLDMAKVAASTPLRVAVNFAGDAIDSALLAETIREANRSAGFAD